MKKATSKDELQNLVTSSDLLLCFFTGKNFWGSFDLLCKVANMLSKYPIVKAIYLDIDETPQLSADYSVFIAPTVLVFTMGQESIRESKFIVLDELESSITRYIELMFS